MGWSNHPRLRWLTTKLLWWLSQTICANWSNFDVVVLDGIGQAASSTSIAVCCCPLFGPLWHPHHGASCTTAAHSLQQELMAGIKVRWWWGCSIPSLETNSQHSRNLLRVFGIHFHMGYFLKQFCFSHWALIRRMLRRRSSWPCCTTAFEPLAVEQAPAPLAFPGDVRGTTPYQGI